MATHLVVTVDGPTGDRLRSNQTMNDEHDDADFLRSSAEMRGVRVIHDWSGEESIVSTIVSAVAELSGQASAEPLHHRIDTDALEALFQPISADRRRDEGYVTFPMEGFDVTVDANGLITIEER